MPTCLLCKKDVTSGYVVCGDCAGELKSGAMPPVLAGFAAWLGSELVQNDTLNFCSMCKGADCGNLSVCRKGVTAWFREKAEKFLEVSTKGILGKLKTVCPFPEVYKDLDMTDGPGKGGPRRKIGHIRADYDGHRWWNTVWPSHWDLATDEVKAEMDRTYEALTANDALRDLNALHRFCWSHPEAQPAPEVDDEFNFYLVGKTCDFWVRLIIRDKDYNMYLSAYAKQRSKMTEEFYAAVKKEIAEYQEQADYFIKSGSQSPAVMERWVLKIQALEEKKKHYEGVLRRELDGLDDEFATLKFLSQELQVRAQSIRFQKAA